MTINWQDDSSHILINPAYSEENKKKFNVILNHASNHLPGHIWVSTSGSTTMKWVGLSKEAILASANAVNKHLCSHAEDIWVNTLPDFHVGGLGIWARGYLSGAKVVDYKRKYEKWNASNFIQFLEDNNGTLTALVPTQLFDLVQSGYTSPTSLRTVIVGGGVLSNELYKKAIALGWKVMPSYGCTEVASQIATAELDSWSCQAYPQLKVLSHLDVKAEKGLLMVRGSSLLSVYALFEEDKLTFIDPKKDGWFYSEDRIELKGGYLNVLGRQDEVIKVGGESVDLFRLEALLQNIVQKDFPLCEMTLLPMDDTRLGYVVHLAIKDEHADCADKVMCAFNELVLPFERIRHIDVVPLIPRSALGKILKKDLLNK